MKLRKSRKLFFCVYVKHADVFVASVMVVKSFRKQYMIINM